MATVALIDDHESVRLGLEAACARDTDVTVVFSGSTVGEYLCWRARSGAAPADLVVLDLRLGERLGVPDSVTGLVDDGSSVMVRCVADRSAAGRAALAAGAAGVVSKASPLSEVLRAIDTVARGEQLNNVEWARAVDGVRDSA